ncbi:lysophospholipid acyltransferase family protein [Marinobacter salicampi]|uniref:lysophospholipid acyltransferase family protein n=1 Tax=Marinobacter salicampi TaxID=435907 RepID=UPI0014082AD3|nr:lysophospholipid acyltransferase family protein [Marinobacter salicampi]
MSKRFRRRTRPLWHPGFWPTWMVVALLFLLSWLPMTQKQRWGRSLGLMLNKRLKSRHKVAMTNVAACFPELPESRHRQIVEDCFVACSRGFLESTHAWWRNTAPQQDSTVFDGLQHLDEAMARGRGVLLIGAHYSIFDFALPLIASRLSKPGYMYRPNNNPIVDRMIETGRRRHFNIQPFTKRQLGSMLAFLKEGGQVWYACDQDFGRKGDLFTPFFGVEANCISTPSYIARESGAAVICVSHLRTPDGNYQVTLSPIQESFGIDEQDDAAAWNGFIEATVRQHPDQYLWLHKRFKTRPEGAPTIY